MIAADPSNPHWVGLTLRRRLGLPLPSGGAMVLRISGYPLAAGGASGRAQRPWVPRVAWPRYMSALPCLEGG
jgi:hypothetical protein